MGWDEDGAEGGHDGVACAALVDEEVGGVVVESVGVTDPDDAEAEGGVVEGARARGDSAAVEGDLASEVKVSIADEEAAAGVVGGAECEEVEINCISRCPSSADLRSDALESPKDSGVVHDGLFAAPNRAGDGASALVLAAFARPEIGLRNVASSISSICLVGATTSTHR